MSRVLKIATVASRSGVDTTVRKTRGQHQDPDRTHSHQDAPEERWASVFGNCNRTNFGKRPSTSRYAVGMEQNDKEVDKRKKNVTSGAQPVRQSKTSNSSEDISSFSDDSDNDSSTRYELATPLAREEMRTKDRETDDSNSSTIHELATPLTSREKSCGIKETERVSGFAKTKHADTMAQEFSSPISKSDMLEDKIAARLTNTMEQMAECMQETLARVDTIQKSLVSVKGIAASETSVGNGSCESQEKQSQEVKYSDTEQKEMREWEDEIRRHMALSLNKKVSNRKLRGDTRDNSMSEDEGTGRKPGFMWHNPTQTLHAIVDSSDDELVESACRRGSRPHSRKEMNRAVDRQRAASRDRERRSSKDDRLQSMVPRHDKNNKHEHTDKTSTVTEAKRDIRPVTDITEGSSPWKNQGDGTGHLTQSK